MPPQEPLTQAAVEVRGVGRRALVRGRDYLATHFGGQLLALLGGAASIGGALWFAFPWLVAAAGCVTLGATAVYAVYCRRQLNDERMLRRRAYIEGKRVQQQALRAELALRDVAIGLVAPGERRRLFDARTPGAREVRQAADYLAAVARARLAEESAATGAGGRRRGVPPTPAAPKTATWKTRAVQLAAEIASLEAEIQALSVPGSGELQAGLDEARTRLRSAREADRVARERHRAGRTPSPSRADENFSLALRPDGSRNVQRHGGTSTPEQIAREEPLE